MKDKYIHGLSVAGLLLSSPFQIALADDIHSLSHGTLQVVLSPLGELVNCELSIPPVLLRIHVTYKYFHGVCDDRGEVPCDGRLTALTEWCSGGADVTSYGDAGSFMSAYGGPFPVRICHSETGSCTAYDEVGRATVTRLHALFALPGGTTNQRKEAVSIESGRPFVLDGQHVRIKAAQVTSDATVETAVGPFGAPENCLLDGCGVVSTAVEDRPSRHRPSRPGDGRDRD